MSGRENKRGRVSEANGEMEDAGSELPTGWAWAELQDVASMRLGKMLDTAKQVGEVLPYLRNINVRWGAFDLDDLLTMRFKEQEAEEFAIQDDDVLVCEGGEPGRAAVWKLGPTNIKFQKAIHRVRGSEALDPRWLMYHLRNDAISGALSDYFTGSTIKHLTGVALKRYAIRFPPLAEQRRIVGKLELLLGKVSSSQQRLSRIPGLLKRFRQSVLAAACSGKLTADWREENRIQKVAISDPEAGVPEIPDSWSWKRLADVAQTKGGVTKGRKLDGKKTIRLPYLRVANVQDGYLDLSEIKEIEVLPDDRERYELKHGDILFTEGGDRDKLGRGTVWRGEIPDCIHQNHIFRARIITHDAIPDFVSLASKSESSRRYFFENASQTVNLASINLAMLSGLPVPLPPLAEQQEIVRRVERLFAFADQIEARLKRAQEHVDRLTQSLLAKAFRGELVPTEHALAAREGREYETASQLLERIRATQAKAPTAKPKRGRRSSGELKG